MMVPFVSWWRGTKLAGIIGIVLYLYNGYVCIRRDLEGYRLGEGEWGKEWGVGRGNSRRLVLVLVRRAPRCWRPLSQVDDSEDGHYYHDDDEFCAHRSGGFCRNRGLHCLCGHE